LSANEAAYASADMTVDPVIAYTRYSMPTVRIQSPVWEMSPALSLRPGR
jgi:hypothetical protein